MARKTTQETTAASPETSIQSPDKDSGHVLTKPQLLDAVVARTNLKKRDVKPAVEAALMLLGDALREGKDLNLPPLGKVRLVKSKDLENGVAVLTLKLRTPRNATAAAQDQLSE